MNDVTFLFFSLLCCCVYLFGVWLLLFFFLWEWKKRNDILHNTVIHVGFVVVWIVESFCLNKKDWPPFVFESFVLLSMYYIQIAFTESRANSFRFLNPSQDPSQDKLRGNFILKNYLGKLTNDNLNLLKAAPKLMLRFFMMCHHRGAQYLKF